MISKIPCCLLVDPFVSTTMTCNTLHEKGIRCIALLTPLEVYSEEYRKRFDYALFEKVIQLTAENKQEILQQLQTENIIFVQAGRDYSVQISDEFSMALCPQYANSSQTSKQRMNKFKMQEVVSRAGLKSTFQYQLIQPTLTQKDLENLQQFNFPVILKPLESSGSFGVKLCSSIDDISSTLPNLFGQKTISDGVVNGVVIQERLTGHEYVVDSMSLQGTHINTCIFRYGKSLHENKPIYRYVDVVDNILPEVKSCSRYIKSALDAIGLNNGLSHAELFLTPTGPCLVEINPRVSGLSGFINYAAKCVYGFNQLDVLAEVIINSAAISDFAERQFKPRCHARIVLIQNFYHRILRAFNTDGLLEQLSSYDSHQPLMKEGYAHKGAKDLSDVIALVVLTHQDPKQIESDTQQIWQWEQEHKLF